jgi:hypothetical protein
VPPDVSVAVSCGQPLLTGHVQQVASVSYRAILQERKRKKHTYILLDIQQLIKNTVSNAVIFGACVHVHAQGVYFSPNCGHGWSLRYHTTNSFHQESIRSHQVEWPTQCLAQKVQALKRICASFFFLLFETTQTTHAQLSKCRYLFIYSPKK